MSLLPLKTSINPQQLAFIPYFDTGLMNASTISTGTIIADEGDFNAIYTSSISTLNLFAETGAFSTFSTSEIVIDSQTLNATPTELLLNGVPVATTSNLSSIADWSYDPAVSTVQMDGNDLNQAGTVSSLNIRAGNGFFTNLIAFNAMFVSTATSTISTSIEWADLGNFSTLNAGTISSGAVVASTLSADTATLSTLGAQGGSISTLSTFNTIIQAGGAIELQNFGISFASVGSAQLGFDWFYQDGSRTDMFYDTNISSVRIMTKTPGAYTDDPPSRLHVPQAGISSLGVSSINGSEFTSTGIIVQVAGVSSLVANSISSIGAEIRQALVSTIVFSPSLNPSLGGVNVNLGLGGILGNVIGWGAGVFGAAAGTVGLVTGMVALATGRQSENLNTTNYELVNGTTQLQFSTLGTSFSTIYRLNDSTDPQSVPGEEIFVSTIHPPGVAVRSISDPIYTLSTPNSTIQAFGQWVAVPDEIVNISSFADASISSLYVSSINNAIYPPVIQGNDDWAIYPAISTINFSTGVTAVVAASAGSDIALSGTAVKLIGGYTDAQNLLVVSSISTATILGANDNLFGIGVQGLELRTAPTGQVWISSPQTNIAGLTNTSTLGAVNIQVRNGGISSLQVSSLSFAQTGPFDLSSLMFLSTAALPGFGTSSCLVANTDFSVGQNDIYAQQIRLGYLNVSSQPSEIIFHSPNNTQRAFNLGNSDQTIRLQSTANATTGGYILDTQVNPPFFSTINQSTCLMAYFPSTTAGTIGVSTISFQPPKVVAGAFTSLSTQVVPAADTPFAIAYTNTDVAIGGISFSTTAIVIPQPGIYETTISIQLDKSGGGDSPCDFWFRKNGVDVPNSASQVVVQGTNGEVLGNVSLILPLVANDKLEVVIASSDATMAATFFQSTVTTPYTRPAIPSLITNIKCLNY